MSQHGMFNAVEEAAMARRIGSGEFIDADVAARSLPAPVTEPPHPYVARCVEARERAIAAQALLDSDPATARQRQLAADLRALGR
jgi:hypothetical protein